MFIRLVKTFQRHFMVIHAHGDGVRENAFHLVQPHTVQFIWLPQLHHLLSTLARQSGKYFQTS